MSISSWKKAVEQLLTRRAGVAKGASDDDIARVQRRFHSPLPSVYVEFLKQFGRSANAVFEGEDAALSNLDDLHEGAASVAEESGLTLPDDILVFWGHQGYRFYFFDMTKGDDPPVYVIEEGAGAYAQESKSLSEFLESAIREELRRPALPPNVRVYRHDL